MFLVCDLQLWGVYDGVVRSEEGESEGKEQRKTNRCAQTCKDGRLGKLIED
jgi:hypothetical protein